MSHNSNPFARNCIDVSWQRSKPADRQAFLEGTQVLRRIFREKNYEAVDSFERLLEMDPAFASGYYWRAWSRYLAGDLEQAVQLAEKAIEKAGAQYFYPKMTLANLFARSGRKQRRYGPSPVCAYAIGQTIRQRYGAAAR